MSEAALRARLLAALGAPARRAVAVAGGHGATLWRVEMADGTLLAVKTAPRLLASEARMLRDLAATGAVPVPALRFGDDTLLAMDWIEHDGGPLDAAGEEQAAEALARLHALSAPQFGLEYDVMIGGMPQINEVNPSWRDFFRWKRLFNAAWLAHRRGRLPGGLLARLERLCARLDELIDEPERPALLHGDLWGGNVLVRRGRLAALIDPALYYGDREVDIAFSTLFPTFSPRFYEAYEAHAPLRAGFWEARRDLLNLYPLLVHAYLFGGNYVGAVERIARRFA